MEAWGKFEKAGVEVNRLPVDDLEKFQRIATPIWFKWANKDKDAARVFKAQLEIMESRVSVTSRPTCTRAKSSTSDALDADALEADGEGAVFGIFSIAV